MGTVLEELLIFLHGLSYNMLSLDLLLLKKELRERLLNGQGDIRTNIVEKLIVPWG